MFDIHFFQKTDALKRKIVGGCVGTDKTDSLFDEIESYRNMTPQVFNIETTNHCNLRCVMCPRTKLMTRKVEFLPETDFMRIVDQVTPHTREDIKTFLGFIKRRTGIDPDYEKSENAFYFSTIARCVILHGYGEPLLDPNIVKYAEQCRRRRIPIYFSCVPDNKRLPTIIALLEAELDVLKFSIDALDDRGQQAIRGKGAKFQESFSTIMQVIRYLETHPTLRTRIVVTMLSFSEGEKHIKMHEEFIKLWQPYPVYAYVKSLDNRWYYRDGDPVENRSHYFDQYCEFPWTSLSVMSNGTVVPCSQDYNAEMNMGNVRDQSLKSIWNGPLYSEFRKAHISGKFSGIFKCKDRCDLPKLYQLRKG